MASPARRQRPGARLVQDVIERIAAQQRADDQLQAALGRDGDHGQDRASDRDHGQYRQRRPHVLRRRSRRR